MKLLMHLEVEDGGKGLERVFVEGLVVGDGVEGFIWGGGKLFVYKR